ncbi:pentatricopeptide repeat-containing protein At1g01970 isoform X2 [Andrographis paniculata]|uniref:pentatricopeptide repeat-containing protein At1g01970 isoform X2 n=1 Tax=Andrographis paniculata TaxID=175694 RepID=UPI0021E8B7B7|nr:pentatricopeptide repeat-containing protein At1g01970 isoform X2 [Andrographis paniculata]
MLPPLVFSSNSGHFAPSLFPINCPSCRQDKNLSNAFGSNFCAITASHPKRSKALSGGASNDGKAGKVENSKYKWVKTGPNLMIEEHKLTMSNKIPEKMSNRCKALMKQIICFSSESGSVAHMLGAWVKSTTPRRADWLAVLKELEAMNHPLYFQVAEHAFTEESFEANIRDYTKIIHQYAKQNMLPEAENTLATLKSRGFLCDQVTLTALVHMYSKSGNLKQAEDSFEEMRLLGVPLDRRSYGSMIMAYIRAGMLPCAETLLAEMEAQEIYAGREVYKALLRAHSIIGNSEAAQRVFDAIQMAGIVPDARICGLLINAYLVSGQTREASMVFKNMRTAGVEPNDKCVALALAAYEMENKPKEALDMVTELDRNDVVLGEEASELLVKWFQRLGIVEEVETLGKTSKD